MALVEGGEFQCYLHDYKTASVEDWNQHCSNEEGHTEQGTAVCTHCGTAFEFKDLPYHPIDASGSKNILLKCEDCEQKTQGKVKRSSTTKK